MLLEPKYRNYWLDLARKDYENAEKERQQTISQIVALLGNNKLSTPNPFNLHNGKPKKP